MAFSGFEKIVRQAEPLAMHTWLQLGGPAEYFAEPENPDQLIELVRRSQEEGLEVRLLGHGSNVLVRDEGVPGVVVKLSAPAFCKIEIAGRRITAGGGATLGRVVTTAVHRGLAGLETLIGIPGTLGGALHGNAGSHGGDTGQWAVGATVITAGGEVFERSRDDLVFGYRQSSLDELVILEAVSNWKKTIPANWPGACKNNGSSRRPPSRWVISAPAACSRIPRGASAGDLIEQAGLKGTRIGGAVVSERHANFIIAEPESTSQDVLRLIDLIRSQVRDRLGIDLELEIEIW